MRICHCRRVTDREIVSLVREGVDDADAVGRFCGAGTACGGCRPEVERIVSTARSEPIALESSRVAEVAPS